MLQSIYIVKNNPKIDDFDRKILLFFNFEYEKKYGFVNGYILINVLFYIIHKTEFVHLLEVSSVCEKNINEFEINEIETQKIKQMLLSDKILESTFQKLDTILKEAKDYVKSKTERNYKITR